MVELEVEVCASGHMQDQRPTITTITSSYDIEVEVDNISISS